MTAPETIGRYRIEGVLGEGAMSVIYAGFDPSINRHLAIKCLKDDVARDAAYRRRFLTEARAAGTLNHPNIVTIYDVGEADGRPYIAMERLHGETLAERVAREGFPPIPVVIDLAGQIAAALDFAHRHGVIHQDIKPENIILVEGWTHAKVNDFGVARLPGGDEHHDGMVAGTPAYMAPEQLHGDPTDGRSDLFSLGVLLFWLLTGDKPWRESEVDQLMAERQRHPHPSLVPRDPATPEVLLEIVRSLLQPAAEERYQHGHEVIDDLRHARRELERLRADPVATRVLPMRVRWAAILGTILTMTLLVGLASVYVKQDEALTGLAVDFGASLGRTIAHETAEDLLLNDRIAVRALVTDMQRNEQIRYLSVADRDGRVIASAQPGEVGDTLGALPEQGEVRELAGGIVSHHGTIPQAAGKEDMLLFDVPVRYQDHPIGTLRLGMDAAPLETANRTTLGAMLVALLATLVVVLGAAWWLFRRLLAPMDVLRDALLRVARGDFAYRIRLIRRDEFGRLFTAFNLMNESLANQERSPETPQTGRETTAEPTRVIEPADPPDKTD
ncbi:MULTISPECIES: protein kinase [unclassified Guyparkeria]|uniref:protein kinase domain-containing protein n=1 Tax=unclassified Guyparkeria TaxID=2626246 RepID=UPI0007338835|nr:MULTISPECIES: protein kinase [unclassified Guyparkeria]KTG16629.1 serine/threonine protein kinase [Guyparkeria sp. XI15]OAE85663.1 serine/threonine protein kinase [Guyparkeria sp. WRN-7]